MGRRDDIYSNDLEGAAYFESQVAELPDEHYEAQEEADDPDLEDEDEEESYPVILQAAKPLVG